MKNLILQRYIIIFLSLFLGRFLTAQTSDWISKGIGAGGGLFVPSISIHDNNEFFVPTDMGVMFHSTTKGTSWNEIHFKEMIPSIKAAVQFTSDPNILYGIRDWDYPIPVKSTDGGITWQPTVSDPTNSEAIYIFADDTRTDRLIVSDFSHIYFSNDGGNTFTQIYSTTSGSGILVSGAFWDGNVILLGTNFGVLESTDGGNTFAVIPYLTLPADEGMSSFTASKQNGITRMYCVTLDTNSIYAGLINNSDFYDYKNVYKTDYGSGNNWTKISPALSTDYRFMFIANAKNNIDVVYIAGGNVNTSFPIVFKTSDAGNTWSDVFKTYNNENIYTGWSGYQGDFNWWYGEYALGLTVARNNSDIAIMTDLGFIHSTDNGGNTWTQNYVDPADQNPMNQPTPKGKNYHGIGIENTSVWWLTWLDANNIFASFTDITAIRSTDAGESWSKNYNNLSINSVYMTVKHPVNNKLYAATSDVHDMYQETRLGDYPIDNGSGDIRVSSDNGENWNILYNFGHPVVWIAFDPNNPNKMYASVVNSSSGGIYRCDNIEANPTTWSKLTNPPRTEGHPYNIKILNDGTLVVTYSGRIDNNDNFTQSSGVFVSTDDGQTWQDRSHDDMKYWTKDIIIDPTDNTQSTWYVCVNSGWGVAYGLSGLFKTTDKGLTWNKILDLPRVESCTINPNNTEEMTVTSYGSGLWSTENLHAATPTFNQAGSYPFKHPMRVFYDPYHSDKVWVTSFGNGLKVGNVTELSNSKVLLQTKIFLEGPYNSTTNEMNTDINGQLPLTSPYTENARTVSSIPANIVDWVLVQLRQTATGNTITSKSAFLRKDGRIVADDGITEEIELSAQEGNYFIVIKHRNHLAVMSANSVALDSTTSTLYDFTISESQFYGSGGAVQLESGVWGMWSGDTDGSGVVDAGDRNSTWNDRNKSGYENSDVDLSGVVDAADRNKTWNNRNKSSALP